MQTTQIADKRECIKEEEKMATVITATIGTSKTKVCEINTATKVATIERAFTVENPVGYVNDGKILDIDAMAEFLRDKILENGITSKEVIFVLKSTKTVYKEVYTPILKGRKLKDFIRANASEYFPMEDIENYVIADKLISQVEGIGGEKQYRIGLYAASKEMVEDYYTLAEKIGLIVKNVESYNNATVSFLNKQVDSETSVVIYVHDDSTTVNIYKDNILELQRNIPYGKDVVIRAVMEEKEMTKEAAEELIATKGMLHSTFDGDPITESLKYFVNSIIRVVDYYTSRNNNNTVQKAYLTGESMAILGLESLFVNEFMKNSEQIKKFRSISVAENYRFEPRMISKYISCIGGYFEPVNFVSEKIEQKRKKDKNTMYLTLGLVGVVLASAVWAGIPFVQKLSYESDIEDLNEKIAAIKDVEIVVGEYYDSVDKVMDIEMFKSMASGPNDYVLEFIYALEKAMPSDTSIKNISIANGDVVISGVTSSKQTIAKFLTQLKSIDGVSDVYVASSAEDTDAYGVVSTSFSAVFSFNETIKDYTSGEIKNDTEEVESAEGEEE